MGRGPSKNSLAQRMADYIRANSGPSSGVTTAQVQNAMQMSASAKVSSMLTSRRDVAGGVRLVHGVWVAFESPLRAGNVLRGVPAQKRMHKMAAAARDVQRAVLDGVEEEEQALRDKVKASGAGKGSGVIAGPRQAPDPKAVWKGHTTPGPIRPGARDYEAVPSRHGDTRHPYHIGGASIAAPSPAVSQPAMLPGVYPYRTGPQPTI
jgi:hypothetical protein